MSAGRHGPGNSVGQDRCAAGVTTGLGVAAAETIAAAADSPSTRPRANCRRCRRCIVVWWWWWCAAEGSREPEGEAQGLGAVVRARRGSSRLNTAASRSDQASPQAARAAPYQSDAQPPERRGIEGATSAQGCAPRESSRPSWQAGARVHTQPRGSGEQSRPPNRAGAHNRSEDHRRQGSRAGSPLRASGSQCCGWHQHWPRGDQRSGPQPRRRRGAVPSLFVSSSDGLVVVVWQALKPAERPAGLSAGIRPQTLQPQARRSH